MPFVAADLGNFTGGLISGYCIRRGVPVVRARAQVCIFSCLPMLAGIPAVAVHSVYAAMALICFALWGYASWSTMGLTLPSDLFPQDVVATVTGLSGLRYLWGLAVDQILSDEQLTPLSSGQGYDRSTPGTVVWPLRITWARCVTWRSAT